MSNTLTIANLTDTIAAASQITKKAAKEQVDTVVALLIQALVAGDSVRLHGLGTLSVVDRAGRAGRNPQTGEALDIPAYKAVKFKTAQSLKDAVNGSAE